MYRQNNLTVKVSKYIKINTDKMTKVMSVFMLVFLIFGSPVFAELSPQQQAEYNKLKAEISNIDNTLSQLRSQKNTLANELQILDTQAQAIQMQINASGAEIIVLNSQIEETNVQILNAEEDLKRQKELLQEYIKIMYMDGQTSQVELILTSNSFSDFVDQSQYMDTMTQKIQEATALIEALKLELATKKNDLEVQKAKAEQIRVSQQSQKNALDTQRWQRSLLISQTNGSEAAYQTLRNGKASQVGVLECIAMGGCRGDANGQLIVENNYLHYYQWQDPWGSTEFDSGSTYADVGCLITSLAMYHGITPPEEKIKHSFSNGYMQGNTGVGVTGNWTAIDSRLLNGGEVLFRLNMGSYKHFVLAVGLRDGQYIINDPYFEPGTTYNLSRIEYAEFPY